MDKMGHINNAVFLSYFESARIDIFEKWDYIKIPFIMVSAKIDYIQQLYHPSILCIGSKIDRIGKTSFDIKSAIFSNGDNNASASAIITCVCFDYENQKTIPVPNQIKNLLIN